MSLAKGAGLKWQPGCWHDTKGQEYEGTDLQKNPKDPYADWWLCGKLPQRHH